MLCMTQKARLKSNHSRYYNIVELKYFFFYTDISFGKTIIINHS